jgi:putative lipoic acid-binding regulatory protein
MNDKINSTPSSPRDEAAADPQDGFDLLEYPLDYNFKALCHAQEGSPAVDYILVLIEPILNDGALIESKTNSSRTGKFESVTAIVRINNRYELESIYELIAQSPRVVMTL